MTFGAIQDFTHDVMSCKLPFFFLQPIKITRDGIVGVLQVMLSMISSMHFVLSIDKIQCHCITVTTFTVLGSILSGEVTKFFA